MEYKSVLKSFSSTKDFFIGIDSDGCVFDTMEVKQKEFFIPNAIRYFDLFSIAGPLRETWEFVNLYSVHRGMNRFISLVKVFDMLEERKDVSSRKVRLPDTKSLKEWISNETSLSNATLRKYCETRNDSDLKNVLAWTEAVNRDIGEWLHDVYLFPNAEISIRKTGELADIIVVSQTPVEALEREWENTGLKKYVKIIAGQEHGTKAEHLACTAKGKYPDNKILMIGDAPGDLKAANENGVLFFPVIPGKEDQSWELFLNEGLEKFVKNTFSGSYQDSLIKEFNKHLPANAPWK